MSLGGMGWKLKRREKGGFFSGVAVVLHCVLQQAFYISVLPGVNSMNSHLCSLPNVAFPFRSVLKQQLHL